MFVRNCKAIVNNYFGFLVKEFSGILRALLPPPPGGGGTARPGQPGYAFRDFCLKQGIEFIIFCLNQGIDLSIFVLNRMPFLGRYTYYGAP